MPDIAALPGFRRRFIISPAPGVVSAAVEDDYHCMSVTVRHEGGLAVAIEPDMRRAPWSTCPGATEQLKSTFQNAPLAEFAQRGEKPANCTHLHDLAVLAAAHASDDAPLIYDVLVADPMDGSGAAELRRNGEPLMSWTMVQGRIATPAELAGRTLFELRDWIDALSPDMQEAARVFRWGAIIAHGRMIPLEKQSDATRMPVGNCYTFQPHSRDSAKRVGEIRDFSSGAAAPLQDHPTFGATPSG